jgi:MFS family permease
VNLQLQFRWNGLFHGWKIAVAGVVFNILISGLIQQSFGSYFATLADEKGWSKTALSGAYAMMPVEAAILGPILGWAIDRFGARALMRAGVFVFGLGFMLLSQVDSLPYLYLTLLLIALGSSLCGHFPMNVLIIHWFEKRRARALSIVMIGQALGGLLVPAVAFTMHAIGWRWTAFLSGVVIYCIGFPLLRFIIGRPADIGQKVDGDEPIKLTAGMKAAIPAREFSAREAIRTRAFWLVSLGHGFALLTVTAVNVHAITHIKEQMGYSVARASLFITVMLGAQIGGVALGMTIGDRYEKRYTAAACMVAHMIALLLLAYAVNPLMLIVFALLHGAAWGLRGPMMQAIRADYFGRKEIGMIMGISALVTVLGQIGGSMIAGGLADLTGNYRFGLTLLAVMAGLGSSFFLLAKKPV